MSSPDRSGPSPLTLALVGALVVLLGVVGYAVIRNRSGAGGSAGAGMHIPVPAGWQEVSGESGQMMAQVPGDLAQDVPTGPRIQVRSSDMYEMPSVWASGALSNADPGAISLREGPSRVSVGTPAIQGTAVTIQEMVGGRSITTRQIIVPLGGGRSVAITLAGPTEQFDSYQPVFAAALNAAVLTR